MVRFDIKLISENEAQNDAEAKIIHASNLSAQVGMRHLKKLLRTKRCHKHPSAPNKIRVFAVKGGDPKAEVVSYCCSFFLKQIK
jgi:hypothetical protein